MMVGSLFSGIGGFDLGLERAGMSIEWQVEIDDYCREVLKKHWPTVPCHYDIRTIDWRFIQPVDLVCGGFPCQPFSLAGQRRGHDDDRYLWPEVVRCLEGIRPTWAILENVAGFSSMAQFDVWPQVDSEGAAQGEIGDLFHRVGRGMADEAVETLEGLGYEVQPIIIPACGVDAPHIRQRIWIVAYHASAAHWKAVAGTCEGFLQQSGECVVENDLADTTQYLQHGSGNARKRRRGESSNSGADIPNSDKQSMGRSAKPRRQCCEWPTEPAVGRVADGVPARVDRLRGLGNAIVPQIAEEIGKMILKVSA